MQQFRFYNTVIKKILGYGYPYYIKPDGRIVTIVPTLNKKEPDFKEEDTVNISYHINSRLSDSTGKFIFEGDIINIKDKDYEVLFEKGCFLVKIEENKSLLLAKIPEKDMKINGNILEKPITKKTIKVTPIPDFSKMNLKQKTPK